ncbi:MAG: SAM-dependent methyltransferase [Acidimicrobiales bacterium]|jgi:cyclopropane-fatty-acyl-phospholipid synthase|nr:SAM-dependent methyltransferase [Acidimicrobiales bacterium]
MTLAAAEALEPLFAVILGPDIPVAVEFWDSSRLGPTDSPARIIVRSPDALRRILYAPNEIGFARAYVCGDADIEGDMFAAARLMADVAPDDLRIGFKPLMSTVRAAIKLGVIGRPLPPPPEEARLRGRTHSKRRDASAVSHHYDVSNDFYRLFLGSTMTYSCARFVHPDDDLDTAQIAKYDLICKKLGLERGMRLLDVGCGWGGMVMHAARTYGVEAVGITIARQQYELASKRVAEAGLAGQVEIRLLDYRDLRGETFDAISSIGMFEHVGIDRMTEYFTVLHAALRERGRLLNHAISTPNGSRYSGRSFIARYVFPDGELQDVGAVVKAMQDGGFEVRDVESLREHYARTLRQWVANLEANWDEAVRIVGERRARVWRLYMSGSAVSFENNDVAIHQALGVKTAADGTSGMPATRAW